MATTTDYDAPRTNLGTPETESLDLLQERRAGAPDDLAEPDPSDYDLPGYEVIDEEMSAPIVPVRDDEFRCGSCFLILHRSLHAGTRKGHDTCRDCA